MNLIKAIKQVTCWRQIACTSARETIILISLTLVVIFVGRCNRINSYPSFVVEQYGYSKYICLLPFSSLTPPFSHQPVPCPTDYQRTHVPGWQFGTIHRIWTWSCRGQPIYHHVVQYLWAQSPHLYSWRRFVWPSFSHVIVICFTSSKMIIYGRVIWWPLGVCERACCMLVIWLSCDLMTVADNHCNLSDCH